jgi:hypothetical protein
MQISKLIFSEAELKIAEDPGVILTKNVVIEKVYDQFGELGQILFESFSPLQSIFPNELKLIPKISKGEKYQELPWVMLDYPRCFSESGHFAVRIFFWWGHYYVVMAQFSGKYAEPVLKRLDAGEMPENISGYPVWAGFPSEIWDHRFPQEGLGPVSEMPFGARGDILKMAIRIPIANSHHLSEVAKLFSEALVNSFLTGG